MVRRSTISAFPSGVGWLSTSPERTAIAQSAFSITQRASSFPTLVHPSLSGMGMQGWQRTEMVSTISCW